jgi:hypothetical protein
LEEKTGTRIDRGSDDWLDAHLKLLGPATLGVVKL